MKIDLTKYYDVVEKHAEFAFRKLRKPTIYTVGDLINDGMAVLYECIGYYKEGYKASFKTFLITSLRNYYLTNIVQYSYNKNLHTAIDFPYIYFQPSRTSFTPLQTAELLEIISQLAPLEKEYINITVELPKDMQSKLVEVSGRYKRAAMRKYVCTRLGISEETELRVRRNIETALTK